MSSISKLENHNPVLALIPARGGSKGIHRKNMRLVLGRPLVSFTIDAALNSNIIESIYLSSDDDEILRFGKDCGIEVIVRPSKFSSDEASASDVVQHFISQISKDLYIKDPYIIYLQPTSPLRTASCIDDAFSLMKREGAHTLISLVEFEKSPFKTFSIDENGRLQSIFQEKISNARRQDLPSAYIPNGAIYIFRISDFLERNGFPSNGAIPYLMSKECSIDIDTETELNCVESIMNETNGKI
jgi:CMP-N-acetylneuraminic acid synthetase